MTTAVLIVLFLIIMTLVVLLEYVGYPKLLKYPGILFLSGGLLVAASAYRISWNTEGMDAEKGEITIESYQKATKQIEVTLSAGKIGYVLCGVAIVAGAFVSIQHIYRNRHKLRLDK